MSNDYDLPEPARAFLGYSDVQRCPTCFKSPVFHHETTEKGEKWHVYCNGQDHINRSLGFPTLREAIDDWNRFAIEEMNND